MHKSKIQLQTKYNDIFPFFFLLENGPYHIGWDPNNNFCLRNIFQASFFLMKLLQNEVRERGESHDINSKISKDDIMHLLNRRNHITHLFFYFFLSNFMLLHYCFETHPPSTCIILHIIIITLKTFYWENLWKMVKI